MIHPTTGKLMLRFDAAIDKAASEGDNDLCMELVHKQRDWYEFFGYGDDEERQEYWRRKSVL